MIGELFQFAVLSASVTYLKMKHDEDDCECWVEKAVGRIGRDLFHLS
jgi:hypothetical protein